MRIAFYAPMKSPASPRPSGDRKIARLFMSALSAAGFSPMLASEFRSWEGAGHSETQKQLQQDGKSVAKKLAAEYLDLPAEDRPAAWFTYHLYHKAPDWIGPAVSKALQIPYFVAEASVSTKQENGLWREGYKASVDAIRHAQKVFCINPNDIDALRTTLGSGENLVSVLPFLDKPGASQSGTVTRDLKNTLSRQYKLDPDQYWLLTVAMMREDSKLQSYRILAQAVDRIQRKDWQLIIVGDGIAETLVREYFRDDFERKVHFIGRKDEGRIDQLMQAADLFVWPAVNEALGMVALEALSNGLPTVCGRSGGINQIVSNGETGLLLDDPGQSDAAIRFAEAIDTLLSDPARIADMRAASIRKFSTQHHLETAADQLAAVIRF